MAAWWRQATREGYRLYLLGQGRRPSTVTTYLYHIGGFAKWCGQRHIVTPTPRHVRQHIAALSGTNRNTRLSALRAFYRWRRQPRMTASLRLSRIEAQPREPFTRAELRRLVAATQTPVERLTLGLLMDTGGRRNEVLGLRGADVDYGAERMVLRVKGGRLLTVTAGEPTWRLLHLARNGSGPVLGLTRSGIKRLLDRLSARACVAPVTPHRFRATLICEMLDRGVDPIAVAAMVGHRSLEMVRYYQRAVEARRALAQQRSMALSEGL